MRKKIVELYQKLYYQQAWHTAAESDFFKAANAFLYPPSAAEFKVLDKDQLRILEKFYKKIE